ncbi:MULTISPECIES: sugar transferase [Bacillus]|uniref:sugar transferase n=1 Tax=Bacillus TaxID=1386 RepID=UPI000BF02493|nr:sugar transferase [Bacillus wiedmannii]PEO09442.1 UDP-phosphate galactose phosphotransferase [Bacillus wiedmannii]PFY94086.1 UDP-phosphate galactose phosphotransferase [Bacillus wiedmannii]PGD11564.1 UDP-phosphate galactose phosphotransferase [Bacillus wiedmannii]PHA03980.1 UDP-phosphate galactose phosphotransferase [Bacillus wiedmannii]HDX9654546.1 sugar transferase [Bacillus wiedmannii]
MYRYGIKRIFDIIVSLLLLPFLLLIMIPVAIIIKLEDKGPVFYNAPRLGKGMREFPMYKFRSMKVNAPDIRNEDGSTFNADNDPRVTKIGHILRRTSIDELPQLLNVLKGDMSFVGPRPSPLGNKDIYPKEFFKKFDVCPGITGYNQAVLRNNSTMDQRVKNDVYYVENISFMLDAKIILLTGASVIKSKNINRNSDEKQKVGN